MQEAEPGVHPHCHSLPVSPRHSLTVPPLPRLVPAALQCRKENQVYTAEEKAALAMFNFEENKRKEQVILEEMRRLVDSTLGGGGGEDEDAVGPPPPPA